MYADAIIRKAPLYKKDPTSGRNWLGCYDEARNSWKVTSSSNAMKLDETNFEMLCKATIINEEIIHKDLNKVLWNY